MTSLRKGVSSLGPVPTSEKKKITLKQEPDVLKLVNMESKYKFFSFSPAHIHMDFKSSFMIEMMYFSIDLKTESQSSEGSRQATVALEVILSLVFVGK